MPSYLLVTQRVMICQTSLQAADPREAWALAQQQSAALDITAFSLANASIDLYEADVALTGGQIQAAIAELITHFGYEDITERILLDRRDILAEFAPEGYQDPHYLCVLYKEATGPFYCTSTRELLLKLMEERTSHAQETPADPCLDGMRFAGSVENYNHWKTREFQGKTYLAVATNQEIIGR